MQSLLLKEIKTFVYKIFEVNSLYKKILITNRDDYDKNRRHATAELIIQLVMLKFNKMVRNEKTLRDLVIHYINHYRLKQIARYKSIFGLDSGRK